jgi:hypothetical protein
MREGEGDQRWSVRYESELRMGRCSFTWHSWDDARHGVRREEQAKGNVGGRS